MEENFSNTMTFHFGMEDNSLTTQQLCTIFNCTDIILKNLGAIFYKNLFYTISVEAFEKGSFKIPFTVKVLRGSVISLAASQFFGGFLEGLTGIPISDFGKNAGAYIHNMVAGFFSMPPQDMKKYVDKTYINPNFNFDASLKARSSLYETCLKDNRLQYVSFDTQQKRKVERNKFSSFLVGDLIHELPSEESFCDVIIYKPVNIKKKAKWAFKNVYTNAFFSADIEDEDFLNSFYNGEYPLKETRNDDTLKVLLEESYRLKNGIKERTGISIKRVYTFNGTKINEFPSNFRENKHKREKKQYNLFDKK